MSGRSTYLFDPFSILLLNTLYSLIGRSHGLPLITFRIRAWLNFAMNRINDRWGQSFSLRASFLGNMWRLPRLTVYSFTFPIHNFIAGITPDQDLGIGISPRVQDRRLGPFKETLSGKHGGRELRESYLGLSTCCSCTAVVGRHSSDFKTDLSGMKVRH